MPYTRGPSGAVWTVRAVVLPRSRRTVVSQPLFPTCSPCHQARTAGNSLTLVLLCHPSNSFVRPYDSLPYLAIMDRFHFLLLHCLVCARRTPTAAENKAHFRLPTRTHSKRKRIRTRFTIPLISIWFVSLRSLSFPPPEPLSVSSLLSSITSPPLASFSPHTFARFIYSV